MSIVTSLESCPVCGSPVGADQHACERCGFKLVGQTEIFEAVSEGGEMPSSPTSHHKPTLTITKGPLTGEVFALNRFPLTIGRDPSCDIFLNNMTVSRKHAVLDVVDGTVVVTDTNSLNGIWVDGVSLNRHELVEGSLLQVGTFVMRFSLS
jgi:hypothetical protein